MTAIHITGNLTHGPTLRYTPGGKAVANLSVAENHRVRDTRDTRGAWGDGPTTFWPVTAWGETAEHIAESLTKGDRVVVLGRTTTRTWTPADGEHAGQEQRRLEVVADEVAPSLRWATATITKTAPTTRTEGPDPAAGDDEPPF